MTAAVATKQEASPGLAPFALKDAPSFIEAQFPVGRLSAEAKAYLYCLETRCPKTGWMVPMAPS